MVLLLAAQLPLPLHVPALWAPLFLSLPSFCPCLPLLSLPLGLPLSGGAGVVASAGADKIPGSPCSRLGLQYISDSKSRAH